MYTWEIVEQKILPTVEDWRRAVRMAEREVGQGRDPRPMMYSLWKIAETDDEIEGLVLTRTVGVTAFGWRFVADPQVQQQAEAAQRRCNEVIRKLLSTHVHTVQFGGSIYELQWELSADGYRPIVVRQLEPWEMDKIDGRLCIVEGEDQFRMLNEEDRQRYIWDSDDRQRIGGIMRKVALHCILKMENILEWHNYNRKLKGLILALYDEFIADDQRELENARQILRNLVQHNYGLSSRDIEYQFKEIVSGHGTGSFERFTDRIDRKLAKNFLGQSGTQEPLKYGSRAALQVLQMISADVHYSDIMRVEALINRLLQIDYEIYSGTQEQVPYRFELVLPEEMQLAERIQVAESLSAMQLPVYSDDLYSFLELRKPDGVPEIITWL